nr:sine oculis-binding protein homolog isoform X3 [Crassostrea virginica]
MNELLGLYGFEKFDSTETEHLNVDRFTKADDRLSPVDDASRDDVSIDSCDSSSGRSDLSKYNRSRSNSETNLAAQHRNLVTALTKKHGLTGAPEGTIPSGSIVCAWCQKLGVKLFTLKTSTSTKAFCSELCFDQCRRASFKKNKICDWCKHVRHTVNYVDFQDGETQLQFCSSKCLNQYKMNIFCKETQEHLQQISPTTDAKSSDNEASSDQQILITPDLWLSNAKQSASRIRKKETRSSDRGEDSIEKGEAKSDRGRRRSPSDASDKLPVTNRSILERMHSRDKNKRSSLRDSFHERSVPSSKSPDSSQPAQSLGIPFVPPHMWAPAFGMGIPPMGAVPPWFYPGFMPPGFMPPNMPMEGFPSAFPSRTETSSAANNKRFALSPSYESESSKTVNEERAHGRTSSRPMSSTRSNTPRSCTPRNASVSTPTPPNLGGLPNGVGMMGQNGMSPAAYGGFPPLTMLLPVPVPLPLPIPIPLPLPITMEKLMEVYHKKKEDSSRTKIKTEPTDEHEKQDYSRFKGDVNENETFSRDMLSCASCSSDRSESVNSCVSPMSDVRYSSQSDLLKRPYSPNTDGSLDLSKRARLDDSFSDHSCDGAIDLSNPSYSRNKVYKGKENKDQIEVESASSHRSESSNANGDSGLKIPKIHIISPRHEPPLSQQLPLPPVDPKYASRRGLILDAPCVPKKPRSPSPDRRSYARSVPKDVMDAARRRCMRARIKTK